MFLDYYGFREQPFGVTPDPRYLYFSPSHREALASLYYGLETGRGFLILSAKPGMGKTTLLMQLLEQVRPSAQTVFLFQTQCTSRELLRYLLVDLGVTSPERDLVDMHEQLKEALLQAWRNGKRLILIIDEAQGLEDAALELVRMLSNFETSQAKLMQIVLAGQPTLVSRLGHCTMDPLRQRVSSISRLEPLAPAEISSYVDHRLRVAGHAGLSLFSEPLFTSGALSLLAQESHGIPRIINNLCFNALSLGYAERQRIIDVAIMRRVAADLHLEGEEVAGPAALASHIEMPESHPEAPATRAYLPSSVSSPSFPGNIDAAPEAAIPVRAEGFSLPSLARRFLERLSSRVSGVPAWVLRLVVLSVLSLGAGFFISALLDRRGFPKPLVTEAASPRTLTEVRQPNQSQQPDLHHQLARFCDKVSQGVQQLDKKVHLLIQSGGG